MADHDYHDPNWPQYTEEQRARLDRVREFNRELVAAAAAGRDIAAVLERLDPDPVRYLWVEEGDGRVVEMLDDARDLLAAAPAIPGHVRHPTRRIGGAAATRPAVAGSSDRRRLLAWIDWHPGVGEQVVATVLDVDDEPLVPAAPISGAVTDCFRPTALFDAAERPWVFYARAEAGVAGGVAVYARWHDGRVWREEEQVSTTGHPSFNQEVVAHADGSVECVWQARTPEGFGIYSRTQANGRWGEPRRIDAGHPGGGWDPAVAALPGHTTVYAWSAYVHGTYQLVTRTGDQAGLGPVRELTSGSDYALHPSLAVAGDAAVWCAFDLVTIHGHGGSGPTALRPRGRVGVASPPVMRPAGAYFPPELRPNVSATVRAVRLDEHGMSEDPVPLAQGVEVNPGGLPRLGSTGDGGVTVAYRVVRRLPLLHYYWEVAVQQLGPDGTGPVGTLAESDGGYEEPAVAGTSSEILVACTHDGRRDRALEWSEGFGGGRCAELAAHLGEVAWHGLHRGGEITLAAVADVATARRGAPLRAVESHHRQESRPWVSASRERYATRVDGEDLTLYWGDLHRHSLISRCTSADDPGLDEIYRYAWDVNEYDFWALTDHAENSTAQQWWAMKKVADLFHVPGRFVPMYGFEWTSELGHQNVIFGDVDRDAPIFSSTDERTDRPDKLWDHLRRFPDHPAITIPHHPGADMVAYDWNYYDPEFLRLVEVFQACRGNYEDVDVFRQYADATLPGTFVRDGLRRGHRFGLIASTDHGTGASYVGAYAPELSRESVFAALHARRTLAATARGIVLDVRLGGAFMGSELEASGPLELEADVRGYRDLARIDVIHNGAVAHCIVPELDLPAGWISVPLRVEWGRATRAREWSGRLTVEGGEVLQTDWWAPEIDAVEPSAIAWTAWTHGFGGGGLYGSTRGGVELTVLGPPHARVRVVTASGAVSASLEDLRHRPTDAAGTDAPDDGVLRLQPGTGGLASLGTSRHRFSWRADPGGRPAWYYVRAFQVDGELAWSSPIWVDPPGAVS